ncbi:T9SS type A sorting domain-containing protein [Salmonirosea aquatica]|uniref:T9SS type A sorting domain-containing protein n=1 Tax=Salmonirosea aquatica TaxID=2654236 RepID=A0A7C9F8U9_9BACT|nr:T9SS type A sorting domain-containing protein [Cytophagaceae bacterium SJW1-29]
MKFIGRLLLVTWVTLTSIWAKEAYGQVSITWPTSRTVLQRDKNNSATVYIRGTYARTVDRVEVQLRAINGGATSGWITIQNNPQGGSYAGQIDWTGGWYEMEVRGWWGDQFVGSSTLDRVGIGEVFLLAGQSNAQGYLGYGGPGAGDDRVNCINYYNLDPPSDLPKPEFVHLNSDSYISPRGNSAWAWGRLGDLLASRLGVPILFYNAGWYGSAIKNWQESINGTAYSVYNGDPFVPSGMPYGNLRLIFQNYLPVTGVRAVLWQQGEADNFTSTSKAAYKNGLQAVINQSRNESGKNLSWVIARTSYDNQRGSRAEVINAQNEVVAAISNTFLGPETDKIQAPRPDGAHFQNEGLTQLGEGWNAYLNDDFFARSEPFKAISPPQFRLACGPNNTVSIAVEGGNYTSVEWNNGQSGTNISVGNGRYSAKIKDAAGHIFYLPDIAISNQIRPSVPLIILENGDKICQGSSVALVASTSDNIRWSTGQTQQRITTSTASTFTVTATSVYGCEATSAPVTIGAFTTPPPPKPTVTVIGSTTFCAGGAVTLKTDASLRSIWSSGQEGTSIDVGLTGDYRVVSVDDNGCRSPESDPVTINVNPLPSRPSISVSGNTTFCADQNVTLTSSYAEGNRWNINTSDRSVTVNTSGEYSVSVTDDNGCVATSDAVRVQVNPLPAVPTVTALRPTTFCERDYTVLQSSNSNTYRWNTGSGQRELEVRASGNYSLSVLDANGCQSPVSAPIEVTVNPLPARPAIEALGATTFCADKILTLRATQATGYVWSNGAVSREITTNQTDSYRVQVKNEAGCLSDASDVVEVRALPLPNAPTIIVSGPAAFCEGDTVRLTASANGKLIWSTGATGQTIAVGTTGNYSVQIQGNNGCFSAFSPPVRLEAKPSPQQPVIRQVGTYTLEASGTLPDEEFSWLRNGTALLDKTPVIKAVQAGTYTVQALVQYSESLICASASSTVYTFVPEVGGNGMSVYPNPAREGLVTLETLQNLENATVQILDLKGVVVQFFSIPSFEERKTINVSTLADGIYIIRIQAPGFKATQKLMIGQ